MVRGAITFTERTAYDPLMDILKDDLGAKSAAEVEIIHGSQPDIIFEFERKEWFLSVKLNNGADFKDKDWKNFKHRGF